MCSICGCFGQHDSWCPYNDSKRIFTCACCDEGICDGEKYIKINGKYYHEECLAENYSMSEILEMFGAKVEIARK